MSRRSKGKQPFDTRGGVVVTSMWMLKHENYLSLPVYAKVLMNLLQQLWRSDKYVDYGVNEAAKKIPCSKKTAIKAFKILQERGFITCMEEYWFSSRTESRTRSWRLEWMPFNFNKPRNTWESYTPKIKLLE